MSTAGSEGGVATDAVRALQGLTQLATSPDPPLKAIQVILSSYRFSQSPENRKRPHETDLEDGRSKKTHKGDHKAEFPCELCPRAYSNKGNLHRHVQNAHATKRRLVVTDVFECEECEHTYATRAALVTHMDTHASRSTDAKSPKYKCTFCSKELTTIYHHYGTQHKIDYPEQILFDNGNALILSDINSNNGKAPWFLKEMKKMELYDDVTCRLCDAKTSFGNPEILADHYTLYHKVEPAMLGNLKRLFRAEKGAHLIDLTSSRPKRKQSDISTIKEKVQNKTNLEKSTLPVIFECDKCYEVYASEALLSKHAYDKHRPKMCYEVNAIEALLSKNGNHKHGPKTEEKAKLLKYTCTLCRKDVAQIYKHYGNVHKIEYPEQLLFDNGNVLVRADIDTAGGEAPWFLSEKEKAVARYTRNTCRLCETEYDKANLLEKHYLSEHKVKSAVLKSLDNLRCLFRADKGAHLVDLPASRASKRQRNSSSQKRRPSNKTGGSGVHADQKTLIEEDAAGLIMYQCAECGVAATTCDASIEHAQLHHLAGYRPIPLTCDICNFAFEVQCFADHSTHHLSREEYKIVKFHPSKLLDEWSEMFQGLSESHANRIKASSIYQYTRRVKMNSKEAAWIPLYRCGKCELYVRAQDVEGHTHSKTCCVERQAPGHFCSDCEIYFWSCAGGLTAHEQEHRIYGDDCFKTVNFNCREDETINRALQKLQNPLTVEETPVRIQEKNKQTIEITEVSTFCNVCKKFVLGSELEAHAATHTINENAAEQEPNQGIVHEDPRQEQNCLNSRQDSEEVTPQNETIETQGSKVEETPVRKQEKNKKIIEIVEVSKFCNECKKFILGSESEAHAAMHKINENAAEQEPNQGIVHEHPRREQNCLNSREDSGEVTLQNEAIETEGGVVEQWNSDNDSCRSLKLSSCVVQVDVHIQKVESGKSRQNMVTNKNNDGKINVIGDLQNALKNTEADFSSQIQDNITFDVFSEDMTNDLKRDIEHLGFKEFGIGMNKWAYIPDNLLETLDNDERNSNSTTHSASSNTNTNISQDIFSSYANVTQIGNENRETSPDLFSATTQTGVHNVENNINLANTHAEQLTNINIAEKSAGTDKGNGSTTTYESVFQNDVESNPWASSRGILNRMLSDDD